MNPLTTFAIIITSLGGGMALACGFALRKMFTKPAEHRYLIYGMLYLIGGTIGVLCFGLGLMMLIF